MNAADDRSFSEPRRLPPDAQRRLDAVPDPAIRAMLEELYWMAERNDSDPRFAVRERKREELQATEEREYLLKCTQRALNGGFGPQALDAARHVLIDPYGEPRTDVASLREAVKAIRKVPHDRAGKD